jgi:hypothetical protein
VATFKDSRIPIDEPIYSLCVGPTRFPNIFGDVIDRWAFALGNSTQRRNSGVFPACADEAIPAIKRNETVEFCFGFVVHPTSPLLILATHFHSGWLAYACVMTNTDAEIAAFRDAVKPALGALEGLRVTSLHIVSGHTLPAHDSMAMAEMALETEVPLGDGHFRTVSATRTLAGTLLAAADDHLRSIGILLDREDPAMFGGSVLTRSLLEAAGASMWLYDPAISLDTRSERVLTELLYSAAQERRLPSEVRPHDISLRESKLQSVAGAFGLAYTPYKSSDKVPAVVGRERRISNSRAVKLALGSDTLGTAAYHVLSAASHGVASGLADGIEDDKQHSGALISPRGRFTLSVQQVIRTCGVAAIGFSNAMAMQLEYNGWMTDDWLSASEAAISPWKQMLLQAGGEAKD